ncbi:MAG TPA: hypothetical protein PKM25_04515 [Candidatus Ozemobacteraceae bacterium]|nr:hypothetical protein [Candidatus Ozemobacteraceae bacterium]
MNTSAEERRFSLAELAVLVLLVVVGFALRAWGVGRESLSPDDAWAVATALMEPSRLIQTSIESAQNPLYCLVLHYWILLTGTAEAQVRMLSVLLGAITIIFTARFGKKIHSPAAGIFAAALLCFSLFQIHLDHDVRTYALLNLLVLLSMLSAWNLFTGNSLFSVFAYLFSSLLIIGSHNLGLFAIVAQNVFLVLWYGRSVIRAPFFRRWLAAQSLIAAAFMAWAGSLSSQFASLAGGGELSWIPTPSLQAFLLFFLQFAGATTTCNHLVQFERIDHSPALLACFLLIFLAAAALIESRRIEDPASGGEAETGLFSRLAGARFEWSLRRLDIHAFLFCWMFVPLLGALAVSQFSLHIFVPKPLGFASIPLFIWAGIGLTHLRNAVVRYSILMTIIILSLLSFEQYHSMNTECQWREAAAFIEENSAPGDLVLLDIWYSHWALDQYLRRKPLVKQPFPFLDGMITEESLARLKAVFTGHKSVWLVLSHSLDFDEFSVQLLRTMLRPQLEQRWFGIKAFKFAIPTRGPVAGSSGRE